VGVAETTGIYVKRIDFNVMSRKRNLLCKTGTAPPRIVECKKKSKQKQFPVIVFPQNVAFLIPKTSHFFCIRLRNQEYSCSQLPTKIEKLEAYFFLHATVIITSTCMNQSSVRYYQWIRRLEEF
jgi:late competence protein required for DNA uptake (superfamily II DNA/RNA helicase)